MTEEDSNRKMGISCMFWLSLMMIAAGIGWLSSPAYGFLFLGVIGVVLCVVMSS